MPIRSDKLIFYHVPKTGGHWVKKAFKRAGIKIELYRKKGIKTQHTKRGLFKDHLTPADTPDWFKQDLYSFCIVRHPVSWYKSFWCHRKRSMEKHGANKPFHSDFVLDTDEIWDNDFTKFASNVVESYPDGYFSDLVKCYFENEQMDFVGRQENLLEDISFLLNKTHPKVNLEKVRKAGRANAAYFYSYLSKLCISSNYIDHKIEEIEKWVVNRFYAK